MDRKLVIKIAIGVAALVLIGLLIALMAGAFDPVAEAPDGASVQTTASTAQTMDDGTTDDTPEGTTGTKSEGTTDDTSEGTTGATTEGTTDATEGTDGQIEIPVNGNNSGSGSGKPGDPTLDPNGEEDYVPEESTAAPTQPSGGAQDVPTDSTQSSEGPSQASTAPVADPDEEEPDSEVDIRDIISLG